MFNIRKMNLDDFNNIKDILELQFDDFWNSNILKSELENENSRYICIVNDENVVLGFAGILISPDISEVTNIVIRKDMRNNGLGKKLFQELLNISKKEKRNRISLEVNSENIPAIKLYESFGFDKVYVRKKYYNNKFDAIIMAKNI